MTRIAELPLAELRPYPLGGLDGGASQRVDALWFVCPRCPVEHWVVVPFAEYGGIRIAGTAVWRLERGTGLHDLTLSPTVVTRCGDRAEVRNGEWLPCAALASDASTR